MTTTIEAAAGIGGDGPWSGRANVLEMAETCRRAILHPAEEGGLSRSLRAALACRMARLNDASTLAKVYGDGLAAPEAALADPTSSPPTDARLRAIVRHVDLTTRTPRQATRDDIDALVAAGMTTADVVRLSQLVAFVNFEIRTVLGLRLLGAGA